MERQLDRSSVRMTLREMLNNADKASNDDANSSAAAGSSDCQPNLLKSTSVSDSSNDVKNTPTEQVSHLSLADRISLHEKVKTGNKCDLESPASQINNASISLRHLLSKFHFASLPPTYQDELIRLLPDCDRVKDANGHDRMTVNSLTNEFFSKSCVEWLDRLKNGEFCLPDSKKQDTELVIWEYDADTLPNRSVSTDIPKAGNPFIPQPKVTPESNSSGKGKSPSAKLAKLKKQSQRVEKVSHAGTMQDLQQAHMKKVVLKAKAVSASKQVPVASQTTRVHTIASPVIHSKQVKKLQTFSAAQSSARQPVLKRVVDSFAFSSPRVIPVVRKPQGQVVTTLASCNPILIQMIRRPNENKTLTGPPPAKVARNGPIILKQGKQPVIVTLGSHKEIRRTMVGANGVTKVITSQNTQQPVSVNNGVAVNGKPTNSQDTLNLERSRQICESSKTTPLNLKFERSVEICKQVLQKTPTPSGMISILGGKTVTAAKSSVKPVRKDNAALMKCDLPLYKNKYRGKPTITSHLFLALRPDEEGYAVKAYKKRTSFKPRPKKKHVKGGRKTTPANQSDITSKQNPSSKLIVVQSDSAINSNSQTNRSLLSTCMCSERAMVECTKCGAFSHSECMTSELCRDCQTSSL